MRSPITVDFTVHEIYEAGALLLTHLAYPEKDASNETLGGVHASLCALALRQKYGDGAEWEKPQLMKPVYAFRSEKEMLRDLKALPRRFKHRMIAGRMAMAFIKEGFSGVAPELPKDIKRLSLNEISFMVLKDSDESEPENIEKRIWRPSLPVLHICAATQFTMQMFERAGMPDFDFTDLLHNRTIIEAIVITATKFQSLLSQSKLKIDSAKLINLNLRP